MATSLADDSSSTPIPSNRLSFRQKLGFGMGDFAINLFWQTTSIYLLFYYTDVLALSPAIAGWIFGLALLWDAAIDPIAGYIADRTRTRWGSYRPYLLFGCVPLALSFAAMFIPVQFKETQLLVFVLITHGVFRTIYTVLSMPYNSLTATLTSDSRERGSLAAYRMACGTAAAVFVAYSTLKLVEFFGGGNQQLGFLWTGVLYAALSVPIFLITFASTRESIKPPLHRITLREAWRVILCNRAFLMTAGFIIGLTGASTFLGKMLPYVLKYTYQRPDQIGTALSALTLAVFISIPFWAWIMRRTSKKTVALCGISICMLVCSILGITGTPALGTLLVLMACYGLGGSAQALAFWSMVPDTVEYGQWRVSIRGEGVIFGFVSLAQKAALGFAVAGVGHSLDAIGYVANQTQTDQTTQSLYVIFWQMPLIFFCMTLACLVFYPLSPLLHKNILLELERRKTSMASAS